LFRTTRISKVLPSGTFWAGITFDDNNGTTGATLVQLDNLGKGVFRPLGHRQQHHRLGGLLKYYSRAA
jgi:hypothetical protein